MAMVSVQVPDIGDASDVEVVEIMVAVGDRIDKEQSLIVLESDKASMEIPAPEAGVVKEVKLSVGDKVSEGALILMLESEGAGGQPQVEPDPSPAAAAPAASAQAPAPGPAQGSTQAGGELPVTVPDIGDASDVEVVEVLVQAGSAVDKEQSIIVLESDKASMEIPSPAAGVVLRVDVAVGDRVSQGAPVLVLETTEDAGPAAVAQAPAAPKSAPSASAAAPAAAKVPSTSTPVAAPAGPTTGGSGKKSHATPSVRKLGRELGVDLGHVPGTGPHGRITREDVQRYVKHAMSQSGTQTGTGFAFPELPAIDFTKFGEVRVEPMTKIQKVSARNLHRSWVTIPHVTQFDRADITELEAFRKKIKGDYPDAKITLVSFFMKALVVALKRMPKFNSSLDHTGENLVFKQYFHIGVAVDTDNGLVVPVIRDVDIKGLVDIAKELGEVSARARARKLSPQDMQGASMTISSLGGVGGTAFTPIINPPEVAILGVSRAEFLPVYKDGGFVPRLICPLSLSYDHRVVDGADAARFTTLLGEVLGDIRQILL